MKGPSGLKVGMIVYKMPDIDGVEEGWDQEDFNEPLVVVGWPGGGFGTVVLNPEGIMVVKSEASTFIRGGAIDPGQSYGMIDLFKITDDTEWFLTQKEAILAAAAEEQEYSEKCRNRARVAREIASKCSA